MSNRLGLAACAAAFCVVAAMPAYAQISFNYGGAHPIHPAAGGGVCYAGGVHSHPYDVDPNLSYLYRNNFGTYYFAGNVYEFGFNRQAFPYYNHHPLPPEYGGSYCYLDGSHYHHFAPSSAYGSSYVVHNGYYYYNGIYPSTYYSYRPSFYRDSYSYRYLPSYSVHYTSYNTYATTYSTPASVSYIHHSPRTYYTTTPRVTVYRTASPTTVTRTYTTTYRQPVYRYNSYRPNYQRYSRPVTSYSRTTTITTTRRVWRR